MANRSLAPDAAIVEEFGEGHRAALADFDFIAGARDDSSAVIAPGAGSGPGAALARVDPAMRAQTVDPGAGFGAFLGGFGGGQCQPLSLEGFQLRPFAPRRRLHPRLRLDRRPYGVTLPAPRQTGHWPSKPDPLSVTPVPEHLPHATAALLDSPRSLTGRPRRAGSG